ncbi:MAG: choice-of-anchor J domain-containing protein [Bacteroidia bacterium]
MWKVSFVLAAGLLLAQSTWIRCYTMQMDSMYRKIYRDWPSLDAAEPLLAQTITEYKQKIANQRTVGGVYTIPVVIHIIHDGEPVGTGRNLSDAQVQSQIDVLNEDFRRQWGTRGWSNDPRAADVRIEFRLAQRTPTGAATTGIVRWNRNTNGWAAPPYNPSYIDANIKPATQWDPNRYLNIWVCEIQGGILGYAKFPDLSGLLGMPGDDGMGPCNQAANQDGVVINYFCFGSQEKGPMTNPMPPYHLGRTTTHEVGHWLGLRHIWGDNNCGDDFIEDTPTHQTNNSGCPNHPKSNACGTTDEMFENYMDYSDDGCMNIFTLDQTVRMRVVLENAPRRKSLITSPALIPPSTVDAGIVDILSPLPIDYCTGSNITPTVQLQNRGSNNLTSAQIVYRLDQSTWNTLNWTGNLAPNATANVNLPPISPAPGWHTFTALSQNPNGSSDPYLTYDTVTVRFLVHDGIYPLIENFERNQSPPPLWRINNPGNDCFTWREGGAQGPAGRTTAMYVNHWAYTPADGQRDELYTPIIDLTGVTAAENPTLSFNLAHRRYDNTTVEALRVEISTDCGATWSSTPIYNVSDPALATAGNTTARYIPNSSADWRTETVNLNAFVGSRIRLRFVTVNGYGNNTWIDNIRITHRPYVFFADSAITRREEPLNNPLPGDCRPYQVLAIPVYINSAPSTNVNVLISALGSLRNGIDYDLLTPTLTFPAGSTTPQNIQIRLYDDNALENTEDLWLTLSIAGGPALVDPQRKSFHLYLENNDFFPPEVMLFEENFESGNLAPWTIHTITAGANTWVVGPSAGMSGTYAAYISNNTTTKPYAYNNTSTSGRTFVSPTINTTNATDLWLSFDVKVGGEYSSPGAYDFGRLFYSTTTVPTGFQPLLGCAYTGNACYLASLGPRDKQLYGHPSVRRIILPLPSATWNQPTLYLGWRWDNDNTGGTNPPLAIDNIRLVGRKMPPIETNLITTQAYLGPDDSLYIYSPAGDLMTYWVNQSSHDYQCTQVQIDRNGNSAQPLRPGHTPPQHVTDKTFLFTPASNLTTGNYRIRLYYTPAEASGYTTATGNSWSGSSPNIVKTQNSITAEYSAPTPTYQLGLSNTAGQNPTNYYYVEASFGTGFSGMAAGIPPPLAIVKDDSPSIPSTLYITNPLSEFLEGYTDQKLTHLVLRDLTGRVLASWENISEGKFRLALPVMAQGVYLLEGWDENYQKIGVWRLLRLP